LTNIIQVTAEDDIAVKRHEFFASMFLTYQLNFSIISFTVSFIAASAISLACSAVLRNIFQNQLDINICRFVLGGGRGLFFVKK